MIQIGKERSDISDLDPTDPTTLEYPNCNVEIVFGIPIQFH